MKKKKRYLMTSVIAAILLAAFTVPGAAIVQQTGIKRTELQRHDISIPGREAVQVRIDFDPGTAFGKHSHPGEEVIYVLTRSNSRHVLA